MDYIFAFLAILTPVVFIHEMGHYWVARKSGVVVEVFSIGFGPELFARVDKQGTRWRIAALPLGGYVKMRGDENATSFLQRALQRLQGAFLRHQFGPEWLLLLRGQQPIFFLGFCYSPVFTWE